MLCIARSAAEAFKIPCCCRRGLGYNLGRGGKAKGMGAAWGKGGRGGRGHDERVSHLPSRSHVVGHTHGETTPWLAPLDVFVLQVVSRKIELLCSVFRMCFEDVFRCTEIYDL